MPSAAPFESIGGLLERSLSIRHVYGDAVQRGETTVIPVARVAYVFGGGGGHGPNRARTQAPDTGSGQHEQRDAEGAGGGGAVTMTPVGALEIGPAGTRFIRVQPLKPLLSAVAAGVVVGWLIARRR